MSVGSISSQRLAQAAYAGTTADLAAKSGKSEMSGKAEAAKPVAPSIADHVAAAGEQEAIRSANVKQGTLVDTYL